MANFSDNNLNNMLVQFAKKGDVDVVRQLLEKGANPSFNDAYALRCSASHGHAECVEALILGLATNPDVNLCNGALVSAVLNGHSKCIKLLIPVSDPKADNSQALSLAARNGYADCVKLLIPVSDPKADNSKALSLAARNGYADCVKLLIPVSDPKADNSKALREAQENDHLDCVTLLTHVSVP